jgi:AcrR family transcriptional regulator
MRTVAGDRRQELLEATAEYLLRHGVAGMSLRPLAVAIGSSARLLIYHFGSKERLLIESMGVIRLRARGEVEGMLTAGSRNPDLAVLVRGFWRWSTATRHRPYLRLLFEVHGLALQYPRQYAGYLEGSILHWIDLLTAALQASLGRRARPTATLIVGTIDGLLMDYLSTGDLKRTSRAIDVFAAHLSSTRRNER